MSSPTLDSLLSQDPLPFDRVNVDDSLSGILSAIDLDDSSGLSPVGVERGDLLQDVEVTRGNKALSPMVLRWGKCERPVPEKDLAEFHAHFAKLSEGRDNYHINFEMGIGYTRNPETGEQTVVHRFTKDHADYVEFTQFLAKEGLFGPSFTPRSFQSEHARGPTPQDAFPRGTKPHPRASYPVVGRFWESARVQTEDRFDGAACDRLLTHPEWAAKHPDPAESTKVLLRRKGGWKMIEKCKSLVAAQLALVESQKPSSHEIADLNAWQKRKGALVTLQNALGFDIERLRFHAAFGSDISTQDKLQFAQEIFKEDFEHSNGMYGKRVVLAGVADRGEYWKLCKMMDIAPLGDTPELFFIQAMRSIEEANGPLVEKLPFFHAVFPEGLDENRLSPNDQEAIINGLNETLQAIRQAYQAGVQARNTVALDQVS